MSTTETTRGCPVHNFNPLEELPVGEKIAVYDRLRDEAPVIWNDFASGYYVVTRHEDVLSVYQDPETVSSRAVTVFDPDPSYKWIPEMLDGDEHLQWRQQLGPLFSPKAVEKLEAKVRQRAIDLIEGIIAKGTGSCDFMAEFAFQYPTSIFLDLMGLPIEDLPQFMEWEHEILHVAASGEEASRRRGVAMTAVNSYFDGVIADRRANPGGDDLVSKALSFQIDGAPVTDVDMGSFCLLLFMAGLDTVSATLGLSYLHLASHPEDRRRIVAEPSLIPTAIEEFIRAYAIVIPARKATKDTEIGGCPIKAGSMIAVRLNAATRDGTTFDDPKSVDITRSPNNHIGFGAGPHRCLGSHLARRELKIALEEWHARIPDYHSSPESAPTESGGQLGPNSGITLLWEK
ncbi:MAG: cytochrome P450 [Rhodococcus sp. (in: high G+C Gram-positive bacteria)]|uniref:cytochrome P450 n=1 Tax=Rhodococcus sp. TaxID=1831 RepID=UPI003BAFE820